MKKLTPPLLAVFLALSTRLVAAEPDSPFGLAPSAPPQVPPLGATQPPPPVAPQLPPPALPELPPPSTLPNSPSNLPLIPEAVPPREKPPQDPEKPRTDKTAVAEDKLMKKIQLRQAKVKAERDPELQALMAKALAAPTDFEQRKYLDAYFNGLCDRMAKFEPALKKEEVDTLKAHYTSRYAQTRIAPTIDPATFKTASAAPTAQATPPPSAKKRH